MSMNARKGLPVALGQIGSQVSSFARHAITARLLTPSEFGIAALFVTALQLVDMVSNAAAETLLVQAPDGDDEDLQASIQWWRAIRGCLNGVIIFLLADFIAFCFGLPQVVNGIRWLALFPILRGFFHVDANRVQRHMRYWPWVISDTGASLAATVTGIAAAYILRDHRAMIIAMLSHAAISLVLSHLMADRPYRWKMDRQRVRRIAIYGWPLMLNGLLMFGIFQGDRLIIGMARAMLGNDQLSLAQLGVYTVAFSLTMAPALALANGASTLFLPMLSKVQDQREEFVRKYLMCLRWTMWVALALAALFLIAGPAIVVLVSGKGYEPHWWLIAWMSLLWSVRMARVAPTVGALAAGDTKNAMFANLGRSLAIPATVVAVTLRASLEWIAFLGFAGEVLALIISLTLLQRRQQIRFSGQATAYAGYLGSLTLIATCGALLGFRPVSVGIAVLVLAASLFTLPGLQNLWSGLGRAQVVGER